MKLKVPTKLDLCGYSLTLEYIPGLSDDAGELNGEFFETSHSIKVSTTSHSNVDELYSTIIHEAMHAVFARSGLNQMLNAVSEAFEESIIRAIENNMRSMVTLDRRAWLESKLVEFTFQETIL